jgi:hypothetical protein
LITLGRYASRPVLWAGMIEPCSLRHCFEEVRALADGYGRLPRRTDAMRIEFEFGSDTAFGMADVFLESADEENLSEPEVWALVTADAWRRHRFDGTDILDFTLYAHDGAPMHFDQKSGRMKPANWEWLPQSQKRST